MNTLPYPGQAWVDCDRYPLDQPDEPTYAALVDTVRADLEEDGCAVLEGFVPPSKVVELADEARRVAPHAHRSFNRTNPYFTADDEALSPDHPVRRFHDRSNAFVPADHFGADSGLRAIYEWPAFAPFVQAVLGERHFFRYADPLADVIVNVVEPGNGFPWHFDTNNYTVTLALANGDAGGEFQYCPGLRSREDERYDKVQAVLDGDTGPVRRLPLAPGDLQIFRGRYTLHRVAPVTGQATRHVAIFSFAERPDMVASPERCRQLYGRVLPVHLEHARRRDDALLD